MLSYKANPDKSLTTDDNCPASISKPPQFPDRFRSLPSVSLPTKGAKVVMIANFAHQEVSIRNSGLKRETAIIQPRVGLTFRQTVAANSAWFSSALWVVLEEVLDDLPLWMGV